jgi:unsaturated chondroitin disaccharide hydrolase
MKKGLTLILTTLIILVSCTKKPSGYVGELNDDLNFCEKQYKEILDNSSKMKQTPVSANEKGEIVFAPGQSLEASYFTGSLWLLFKYSEDFEWVDAARKYSEQSDKVRNDTNALYSGMVLYNTLGNGYNLTFDAKYKLKVIEAARKLKQKYNPKTGYLLSDTKVKGMAVPVLIDDLMQNQLLFWAFKETSDSGFYKISTAFADSCMKNMFRKDFSVYQVISCDTAKRKILEKKNLTISSDSGVNARSQAFALYSYTLMYRETKQEKYLKQALSIADYMMNNKNMPSDKIPFVSFTDKSSKIKDAASAAIMASALIELSGFVTKPSESFKLSEYAKGQIKSLSSDVYRATSGENGGFILKHNVSIKSNDAALSMADYFYIEALLKIREKAIR